MTARSVLTTLLLSTALALPALGQTAPLAAPADAAAAPAADAGTEAGTDGAPATQSGAAPESAESGDEDDDGAAEAPPAAAMPAADWQPKFDHGPSGIMSRDNRVTLPSLTLASGKPVADAAYDLRSGTFYTIEIVADGSAELALSGGDFFRAIWINEIVVNDIEIRPMGVHSLEFDAAGTARMTFVAITPGQYALAVPGSSGETQQAVFTIR